MKYDVVVIGAGPAGIVSAITAKKYYPDKKILAIKNVKNAVIPCGIPYMINTLENPEMNALGTAPLEKNGIEVKVANVTSIHPDEKFIVLESEEKEEVHYEKLILATGSKPVMLPIEGSNKLGVYAIKKEMEHMKNLVNDVRKARNVLIAGGGFIGVEFADEISKMEGITVTLVEFMPDILAHSFDDEFCEMARRKLEEKGVRVITGTRVERFNGNERVESVTLSNGETVPAEVVIMGVGAKPNSDLAKNAGLEIGSGGAILVDEYLRTSARDVFAVGDCAEKKDFWTRKKINVMLASTATAEARIAGANLWELKVVRENRGTIATYSTQVEDLVLACAGLTEKQALKEGFEIITGAAEYVDRHPGSIPGASKCRMKLIFSRQSGILLGGQVAGGLSSGELINIVGLALQKNTTLTELETLQIATHPKLTAAPTTYPLIMAAQDALGKYKSQA